MPRRFEFNPERVAYFEKAGWEAYYDRRWLRAFWLLIQLGHEQFHMDWLTAAAAAIDTVRASRAFAPVDNDVPAATYYIGRFYEKARRSLGLKASAQALAALEMDYWVVHRRLANERAANPDGGDIEPMVQSLANLHAALFESAPEAMRRSAELRALSAQTVDLITSKRSTHVPADWRKVEDYLRQAYRAVRAERPKAPGE
ncbi:MAG: hypothetical protein HYR71_11090 [Chloroflexi bacterium]|nr:hypothetical protein [Chloroflexota bacterium]